jgi:hypothetical protein
MIARAMGVRQNSSSITVAQRMGLKMRRGGVFLIPKEAKREALDEVQVLD